MKLTKPISLPPIELEPILSPDIRALAEQVAMDAVKLAFRLLDAQADAERNR